MKSALHVCALGALLLAPSLAIAKKVTVDDLMKLRSPMDVQISPDGKRVAYVVSTPSFETDAHEGVLYVMPSTGGTPVRLTYGTRIFNRPIPAARLRWSPDGSLLSFIAYVDGVPQVMAMSTAGGEPWAITSVKEGVTRYEWAPDSKRIAFLAADPTPGEEEQRKKDRTYVEVVGKDDRGPRLWVQDVTGGAPKVVSPEGQVVVDCHWAPDGRRLIYSASNVNGFTSIYRSHIYTVGATGEEIKTVVDRPGTNRAAQFSPDGRWIAFVSTGGYDGMISAEDLYVVSADGRTDTIKNLTASQEAWIGEFAWAPDSRSIFYITTEQTYHSGEQMFAEPISRVYLDSGRLEPITSGPVVNFSLSVSQDGSKLAYKSVEKRTMGDVYLMNVADKHAVQLTEINPELRDLELADLRAVSWKSFDGKEIWGLLLTPPGYKPGARLPMVVYCHGGPIGGYTWGIFPQFMHIPGQVDPYPSEAMASAGMVILFPMPRGGSGYGVEGFRAIRHSWGDVDYKDIMAGVDAMVSEGIADPDRLGVMGASYGGYMTDWIVTQTGRFKAASAACSVSDLAQLYYLSEGGDFMVEYYGYPWEDGAAMNGTSAINFVTKVTTPLLIQHGEEDHRVPLGQAQEFYKALSALHKTVEFDIYPRGGHVNFEPKLEREYMRRNMEWFTQWLGLGPPQTK